MTPTQLAALRVAIAEKRGFTPLNIAAWQKVAVARKEYNSLQRRDSFSGLAISEKIEKAEDDPNYIQDIPNYPTDPAAALDVIAALGKEGWEFMAMKTPEGEWMVAFSNAPQMKELIVEKVNAPALPLAVALAAAKVWGIKI